MTESEQNATIFRGTVTTIRGISGGFADPTRSWQERAALAWNGPRAAESPLEMRTGGTRIGNIDGRYHANIPDFRQGLPFLLNFRDEQIRYYRHKQKQNCVMPFGMSVKTRISRGWEPNHVDKQNPLMADGLGRRADDGN